MSEEQRNPTKKWFKKLTNIFILGIIVMVLCGIVAFIWIDSTDNLGPDRADFPYITWKEQLQNAVQYYKQTNSDTLPVLNGSTTINGSVYPILDVCPLLISEDGLLRALPAGIWSGDGSADDNCDGGCEGCRTINHYIWAVDDNGSVYSTCVGESCKVNGEDGYQGIFP